MTPLAWLADLLYLPDLTRWSDPANWFTDHDAIKAVIAGRIAQKQVGDWLARLEPADIWCARILDWPELLDSAAFGQLEMLQTVHRPGVAPIRTTRAPLRIDGARPLSPSAAPQVGADTAAILAEFGVSQGGV